MDDNLSVAKGVFVHKNGFVSKKSEKKKSTTTKRRRRQSKSQADNLIEGIKDQHWYQAFRSLWNKLETDIQDLLDSNYSQVLTDLQYFLEDSQNDICQDMFPVAVLLTGINQPDHYEQFEVLSEKICENKNVRSTILMSRDATTLKSAIEHLVAGFLSEDTGEEVLEEDDEKLCESPTKGKKAKLKKGNCIMRALRDWYFEKKEALGQDLVLSIIVPDFELFNKDVLRDLILTVSYYRCQIPLVLVFGVATTVAALENTLPLQFTSKAKFHVFKSQSSIDNLNSIVEQIILDPNHHFLISGKSLQLLVEIFLFYDFSITGFVQGLKFAMLEHFSSGTPYSLCKDSVKTLEVMTEEDLEEIRKLISMRKYIESRPDPQEIVNLLCDEDFLETRLREKLLPDVHRFIDTFYLALRALHVLVSDLPKSAYGKTWRELYCNASEGIDFESEDFQNTINFLQFSTKSEMVSKLCRIKLHLEEYLNNHSGQNEHLEEVVTIVEAFQQEIEASSTQAAETVSPTESSGQNVANRQAFKERLLEMCKTKQRSPFQLQVVECLDTLRKELFSRYLVSFKQGPPALELFVFSDSQTLRKHIVGAPRAAIHQALLNPGHYLQCKCCNLDSVTQLTPSQPDLSIVYKLHLECGKMINLYDWLQAFKAIVSRNEDEDDEESSGRNVDPIVLARFSRAVSELQFLGFIKSSKRKTDHVNRLTW